MMELSKAAFLRFLVNFPGALSLSCDFVERIAQQEAWRNMRPLTMQRHILTTALSSARLEAELKALTYLAGFYTTDKTVVPFSV